MVGHNSYHTFKEACIARGLLEDDKEWEQCLEEASLMKTGYQLRRLFCIILLECCPTSPGLLWNKFYLKICDDVTHKLRRMFNITNPTDSQVSDYGLFLLEQMLMESGKSLSELVGMPLPTANWSEPHQNRLLWEQRQFQHNIQQDEVDENVNRLNVEQRYAYDTITYSVINATGDLFFLNGAAGTGKTFVYNTITATCHSLGHIVVMVASSGIASLLLTGGRTAYSTFKIPIDVMENSMCSFTKRSEHAELFKNTYLIIWDEVPMQHRHCIEAVDRTLQDMRGNKKVFGGITVVLGGDFRQTLPVIPKGVREQIVGASIRRYYLWPNAKVLNLCRNMRLDRENREDKNFADYLIKVGETPGDAMDLPQGISKYSILEELISTLYPHLDIDGTISPTFLTERIILAARNDDVNVINDATFNILPSDSVEFLAADKVLEDNCDNRNNSIRYTSELLNSLNPSSLPPFKLKLKRGCPIMLLRNIAPKDGLCNGTRLMVLRWGTRVIEERILTGNKAGNIVLIPRITLTPSSKDTPFHTARHQFPVRQAFAMTINKSQGQSAKYVGIDLRTPVFSYGQLYVALSRCTSSKRISLILPKIDSNSTPNIVYPEVLL